MLLQQLEPGLTVLIVERLGQVAAKAATFHWFSTKHMDRYVSTFAGRANIRPLDTADQMGWIARNLRGKRLRYRDLIA
ncbi:MAG: malate:quinone oxidoreductase [Synechococcus sp. SB0665_bin_28]|nr:malate:quinone oxidoreductase [Synechococcus sp. SB0665_bin_28]MYF20461.1 malate:quinone oxidoreductase [Synechococcus sp. SB0677_bin_5]